MLSNILIVINKQQHPNLMPKVTCRMVHTPETKKLVLMSRLWVKPSCRRQRPSKRSRGMAIIAPNAVRQCCTGRQTRWVGWRWRWAKEARLFLDNHLQCQKCTKIPRWYIRHWICKLVPAVFWHPDVYTWLSPLLLLLRLIVDFIYLQHLYYLKKI